MRVASPDWANRVTQGARQRLELTSWLGSRRLGVIGVTSGWSIEDADDQQIPGALSFQVPNTPANRPLSPSHPLAGMGQQVTARIGMDVGGSVEWVNAGRFRLEAPEASGDTLTVKGVGLLAIVERARLLAPFKSSAGLTRVAVLQRLIGGLVPWAVRGPAAADTMAAFVCERERLDGIREIAEAWPARIAVSDTGVVEFLPPWNDSSPGQPVVTFASGRNLVEVSPRRDTSSMFNGYSVSTVPQGDAQPVTESWVLQSGPLSWNGPYGQFPGFFSSPTLPTDRTRLRAVAQNLTARAQRRRDAYEVTATPDARVQVGDVARVVSSQSAIDIVGRVTRVTHSATALRVTVSFLSGSRP